MANSQLLGEGSQGHSRERDGSASGGRRVERRRKGGADHPPAEILARLPAVVVLERIPVPTLAIARDGMILFANTAFEEMMGYPHESLPGQGFGEVFHTVPAALSALSSVHALANLVVELQHREGWTVSARMSKSALMRSDDPVVLVTLENLTERLWTEDQ